jgi:hypothetical protein
MTHGGGDPPALPAVDERAVTSLDLDACFVAVVDGPDVIAR